MAEHAEENSTTGSFVRHAWTVSGLTLVSRVAGLARDSICAKYFGAGPVWSAFALAFAIPNLFRRLFGEGALSAAFLPEYTRLSDHRPDLAPVFATLVLGGLAALLGSLTLLAEIALWMALSLTGDDAPAERALAIRLSMIMAPYMPLVCLVAMVGAMLQARGRFGPTASAPILLNLFIIVAAVGAAFILPESNELDWGRITVVAIAVTVAGVVQLVWSLVALPGPRAFRWSVESELRAEAWRRTKSMIRVVTPMLLGLGVLQFNTFLDQLIASYPIAVGPSIFGVDYPLDKQSEAVLYYANRLYQFPLGVFGIAIATAIFPTLARTADDRQQFGRTLRDGLRLSMFIGLPASVGLVLVGRYLTAVVLRGGAFESDDGDRVTWTLIGYAPAVWAYSLNHVLVRAYYAQGDSMRPVRIALGIVALNLSLNLTLIWPLGEAGLAWSTSACAITQTVFLLRGLRDHADRPVDRSTIVGWGKCAIATVAMAIVTMGVRQFVNDDNWTQAFLALVAVTGAGALSYGLMAVLLRMKELSWLRRRET
ncbi:MAG: murein biosynthesis integral membrane protein MurJ [Phycisphaerales bacterium]